MADYTDTYKKAETLLQNALRKMQEGNLDNIKADIELASKYIDMAEKETDMVQNNILYGENKNFGIIYNVFEQNVKNLMSNKKGRKVIKEFINTIKNNKLLKEEFNIYNNCINGCIDNKLTSDEFVNETLSFINSYSKKDIMENNQKLIEILRKHNINEYVEINDNKINLYESIEYVILNKKKINNIIEFENHRKNIVENLEKKNNNITNSLTNEEYSELLENTYQKHLDKLNEDEVELIQELSENNAETVFNSYKDKTVSLLKEYVEKDDTEDKDGVYKILFNIVEMKYNPNTVLEDTAKFIEIQNTIEE